MTDDSEPTSKRSRGWRVLAIAIVLLALVAGGSVYALHMKRGSTPKLVNRPTAAREVKPLSEQHDSRFAPLPIEREKHSK
jgi:hypothetical protein